MLEGIFFCGTSITKKRFCILLLMTKFAVAFKTALPNGITS